MLHAKKYSNRSVFHEAIENKSGTFLYTAVLRVILFLHSPIASSNKKKYFIAVFKH